MQHVDNEAAARVISLATTMLCWWRAGMMCASAGARCAGSGKHNMARLAPAHGARAKNEFCIARRAARLLQAEPEVTCALLGGVETLSRAPSKRRGKGVGGLRSAIFDNSLLCHFLSFFTIL